MLPMMQRHQAADHCDVHQEDSHKNDGKTFYGNRLDVPFPQGKEDRKNNEQERDVHGLGMHQRINDQAPDERDMQCHDCDHNRKHDCRKRHQDVQRNIEGFRYHLCLTEHYWPTAPPLSSSPQPVERAPGS